MKCQKPTGSERVKKRERMAQMIDSLLSRLIVCLHSDDSAVSASQMGSMPVRGEKKSCGDL